MDDEGLIAAVAQGDHTALRELFNRHAPWMAGRLRQRLAVDAVEDVLQETFLAVWRGARAYHGDGAVAAWIWGIARRQAALWARRQGVPALTLDGVELVAEEDPAVRAVEQADVQRALADLGPDGSSRRMLAQLVFVEGRPVKEIAGLLGIPEGTVKSRIHKLRRLLRAALEKGGR